MDTIRTVEGVFRDGKVELLEAPPCDGETRVIVTFLPRPEPDDLSKHGMNSVQAADLRSRLQAFAEDWDRPEMDVYDAV